MKIANIGFSGIILLIIASLLMNSVAQECKHPIFCSDEILTAVANSNYFKDSKDFVDSILKVSVEDALSKHKLNSRKF